MLMSEVFALLDGVEVPMRDGVILRADIWLPGGDGPWPVLLKRTPYGKDDVSGQVVSGLEFRTALRRGYAVMVQDTRGRFASDGAFVPFVAEKNDGVDTIDWLVQQKFCNGQIGMFGASYEGATQVLAAQADVPGLVAIAPQLTTARHGETWLYRQGALELGFLLVWIAESLAPVDLQRRLPALTEAERVVASRLLSAMHGDFSTLFGRLPLRDDELALLAPYAPGWFDSARGVAARNDHVELERLAQSRTPMLVIAGWNDIFLEGALELFAVAQARWHDGPVPDRLIVGPWSHGNLSGFQGETWTGYGGQAGDLSEQQLDFFDAAIASERDRSPRVRYFRTGSNSWHESEIWPVPFQALNYFLDVTDEALGLGPAQEAGTRHFRSDTLDPVPTIGGATLLPGAGHGRNSGPKNQEAIERRADVLVFTSPPLLDDMDVTGLVEAVLHVETSAPTCDWTVKLCEVDAGGQSLGIVDGILRWHRGEGSEVTIRLGHISRLFRTGSRIRLQIASSNFPRFDRNPQSDVAPELARREDFWVAMQSVLSGPGHKSRLVLPVVGTLPAELISKSF